MYKGWARQIDPPPADHFLAICEAFSSESAPCGRLFDRQTQPISNLHSAERPRRRFNRRTRTTRRRMTTRRKDIPQIAHDTIPVDERTRDGLAHPEHVH
jgi:hypothetical protein